MNNQQRNQELSKITLQNIKELCDNSPNIAYIINRLKYTQGVTAGIFGGAVRDWYLKFVPKDIDIVLDVEDPNCNILEDLILGTPEENRKKNKFDGYKLIIDGVSFDIWKVQDARQLKDLKLEPTFENLIKTVPLSTDTIIVTLNGKVYEDGKFWNTIDTKNISLINGEQEDKKYVAYKAEKLKKKYEFELDEMIRDFQNGVIEKHNQENPSKQLSLDDFYRHMTRGSYGKNGMSVITNSQMKLNATERSKIDIHLFSPPEYISKQILFNKYINNKEFNFETEKMKVYLEALKCQESDIDLKIQKIKSLKKL